MWWFTLWIKPLKANMKVTTEITEHGRVCTHCLEFKEWIAYSKCSAQKSWYTANCLECRNKIRLAYKDTWKGKIKIKNYKILKRADPVYRAKEYEKRREWYIKNKEREVAKGIEYWKTPKAKKRRKTTAMLQYDVWAIVLYNGVQCKILERWKRWIWVLLKMGTIRIHQPKFNLKPYKW